MPDIEKVMKGLDCEEYTKCSECPYVKFGKCEVLLMRDAKELLKGQQEEIQNLRRENNNILKQFHEWAKEQKAVKPRVSCVEQRCGNCNKVIEMDGWKACPWCGKPILWEAVGRSVK